jgi:hypothetical protein
MPTLFVGARLVSLPAGIAPASFTVAPCMISLYALTERLAPAGRAAIAMTVLCAGGRPPRDRRRTGRVGKPRGGSRRRRPLMVALAVASWALLLADRGRNVWIIDLVPRAPR